jgi:MurNAc alpha-1-phosphate uridylyltransferase
LLPAAQGAQAAAPPPVRRAFILAAGRGERMRPLSDGTPKPLLPLRGRPIVEHLIVDLVAQGVTDLLVNTAWLGAQIEAALGDGARFAGPYGHARIAYSHEPEGALETAGALAQARGWLGEAPFWLISGDIHAPGLRLDTPLARAFVAEPRRLAHLWLVPNPPFNPQGDFGIDADGRLSNHAAPRLTYANIGLHRAAIVDGLAAGSRAKLAPYWRAAADAGLASAERYDGAWHNIGTPQQLAELDADPAARAGGPARRG